ncbi:uncharacterized protein PRCAT00000232001 [Priceomyces carsonii]|uniref:uncharacterized protein n=1 Tax=Priceomyces carsonii TaxID=28549 RepID=UPI002ED88EBC|nr:unnamed protein product [Priceomyces carsonii]
MSRVPRIKLGNNLKRNEPLYFTYNIMVQISYPSPRVSQLDAHILDAELISLLKEQLVNIFQLHTNSWWTYNHHPELWTLLLNLLVFKLTVLRSGSSYGLLLQNLKLTDSKSRVIIGYFKRYALLTIIVGDYLYKRFSSYLYSINESDNQQPKNGGLFSRLWSIIEKNRTKILTKLNDVFKILNLANFTFFLVNGQYPSLVHRLLGISLTPIISDLLKFNGSNVNFEFQNRQLVWNVMTEFLVFTLPLLQLNKIKRVANKVLSGTKRTNDENSNEKTVTPFSNLPLSQCAICHYNNDLTINSSSGKTPYSSFTVTNPYITNCDHIYCYVCIASKFNAIEVDSDDGECPRCRTKLHWFKEYGDDDAEIDAVVIECEGMENNSDLNETENEDEHEINDASVDDDAIPSGQQSSSDSDYSEEEEYEADDLIL